MNARHVNFAVDDLAAGIRFYSAMFASAPAVLKPDCAKWTLDASRVSVTISRPTRRSNSHHRAPVFSFAALWAFGHSLRRRRIRA